MTAFLRPSVAILAMMVVSTAFLLSPAHAQTFTVLHNFSGGADGGRPLTGTVDAGGNFYGTSPTGGQRTQNCQVLQCGLVWKISQHNSSWTLTPLHNFVGGTDGWDPNADLVFGPDGALYGTTVYGGTGICPGCYCNGCGTVYKLQPSPTRCISVPCPWRETVLYSFPGFDGDGIAPSAGVTFDAAGNIYGPTLSGGSACSQQGCGVVYKLTHTIGNWVESLPYQFDGGFLGGEPTSPVKFDPAGNLYGAALEGGMLGSIYELSPSGLGFTGVVIHRFTRPADGGYPGGVLFYQGNLYGVTTDGGDGGGGFVYQLSPSNGQWILNVLENFSGQGGAWLKGSPMVADGQGNLYGASPNGGQFDHGTVFKLRPNGGGWIYTSLYDFTGGEDGSGPNSVVLDAQGNLYGTTFGGGAFGVGIAFKITP